MSPMHADPSKQVALFIGTSPWTCTQPSLPLGALDRI
jgi:hypothetical protein